MTDDSELSPIPGMPGYAATASGQVWSLRWKSGPRRLSGSKHSKDPHLYVHMQVDKVRHARPIHQLILETFVGPRPTPRAVARHLNGNPLDNRAANLAWGTQAENIEDARQHGTASFLRPQHSTHPSRAKLTESQVREIEQATRAGESHRSLARSYDVSYRTIFDIAHHKTWRHLWRNAA